MRRHPPSFDGGDIDPFLLGGQEGERSCPLGDPAPINGREGFPCPVGVDGESKDDLRPRYPGATNLENVLVTFLKDQPPGYGNLDAEY